MQPRIEYARAPDGANIAFYRRGSGPALIDLPVPPYSHIEMDWKWPQFARAYDRLSGGRTLIRYDARGVGMSDRVITDFSLDTDLLDLEAVVARTGASPFALLAAGTAGASAIVYAASHPERVSKLILVGTAVTAVYTQQAQVIIPLIETSWGLFTETMARVIVGSTSEVTAAEFASMIRGGIDAATARAIIEAQYKYDVASWLPKVQAPTLVMHLRDATLVSLDHAREIVTGIPDATLVTLSGDYGIAVDPDDRGGYFAAIDEFLGDAPAVGAAVPGDVFRTILFTDLEAHATMMSRLGDAAGREVLREHERITRAALAQHGGTEVKTTGDGFMASFATVTSALECAIEVQRSVAERNASAGEPLAVRIGLNAGEPIAEDADYFGTSVIIAARICAEAGGGEIIASNVVREIAAGKGFLFADRGDAMLRGFEDPVRLFEVRWQE